MNKDFSQTPRPTFKRALRRISVISVVISMTLVWLLLSTASIFTLKQYAQKNLELTAATMGRSLEAALVFGDSAAAEETLASLGKQGQISQAIVLNGQMQHFAAWRHEPLANKEQVSGLISKWLFPEPTVQPIWHQGKQIGELRLTALDELISHFLGISILVLTGSILLASFIALLLTHSLHRGIVAALQSITEVVHDIRENRHFSRRVPEERIEEFHLFAQDFNSLLGEMEDWQRQLQAKNAQLLRSSLHDPLTGLANRAAFRNALAEPLTGLANRAAFRNALAELMQNEVDHQTSALLFLDGDNFKLINDNWGHAAGDKVLMEVASRLMTFAGKRHLAWRLGGDEFAVLLREVRSEAEVQALCQALTEQFLPPFNLHNGHSATLSLSVGYALAWEHATAESLQELADQNMYRMKNQRIQQTLK
ncbi:TPA: diguanylate cyclase [Klebsiella pneumoniae]|nr:diguanylate cyclase [Klebsiella pneumoniae]HDZ0957072.1 diguanylate cyclase [Klebsiella pneumoniae]